MKRRTRGLLVVLVGLAHDELVETEHEWILEDGDRLEVDVGVGSFGLSGGGAVEVPPWELLG